MPLNFPPSPVLNQIYTVSGKSWRWNGEGWETQAAAVSGSVSLAGVENEIQITGNALGGYTVGLPPDVRVTDGGFRANYFNIADGATFTGNSDGITLSNSLGVVGNLNISGTLVVDGPIVSKSGFSGYTLDGDIEPITDVSLDGGEF
jgi:hypothetical protein